MTREESGSTPSPTPHCFPGENDGITSVVTGNAAGMLHLLWRAALEKKEVQHRERIRQKYKTNFLLGNM